MNDVKKDEYYMSLALNLAYKAKSIKEVPVGAIVVYNDEVVGEGYNRREIDKDPLAHAEIIAIKNASKNLNRWRLNECFLYVTLEPCAMCTGAIVNSRIKRVIYGADDYKSGSIKTKVKLNDVGFNHKFLLTSGVLQDECSKVLSLFFYELRDKRG